MTRETLIQVSEARAVTASNLGLAAPGGASAAMTDQGIDAHGPVCVIDDDDWVCESLTVLLETYGFVVRGYVSGANFLADARRAEAKCLIIDQHMPGFDGLAVVAELRRQNLVVPVILITGRLDAAIAEEAERLGVLAVLEKPFPAAPLVDLLRRALAPRA